MALQPKLTMVNKVPNIPSILLGLTQWIHTRKATVLRHAMIARAKVICTSRISSIYNTHGRTGSDWGRTGRGGQGVGQGVGLGGRTGGRTGGGRTGGGSNWGGWTRGQMGGIRLGVGLEGSNWGIGLGSDWRSNWGGSDWRSDWED